MKTYDCPRDLEKWGFNCLTGEACGLGLRLLYDVDAAGHAIFARTVGMEVGQIQLSPSWNGGVFDAGSLLLTDHQAMMCALFGMLLFDRCFCVVQPYSENGYIRNVLYGFETEAEYALFLETRIGFPEGTEFRTHKLSTMPGSGDLNQHAMSGRIG